MTYIHTFHLKLVNRLLLVFKIKSYQFKILGLEQFKFPKRGKYCLLPQKCIGINFKAAYLINHIFFNVILLKFTTAT